MSEPIIRVENLSKVYRIGLRDEMPDTLVGALTGMVKKPWQNLRRLRSLGKIDTDGQGDDMLWALKDVSFDVDEGEVVGIIGRNGAGKSTLLKILSHITTPSSGRAILNGRVSSLLEVGTGFHPELTGRENIYMNGTILGMRKREIDRKFDEIVDFSGVEKFLDTPTKRYSSGMKVRLAFAVAAHLEPEILIIDEVLAVGDAEFQKKCLGKMHDVAEGGRTVLFVSHNMAAMTSLCSRGIELSCGTIQARGEISKIVSHYMRSSESLSSTADLTRPTIERSGSGEARFERATICNVAGVPAAKFAMGEGLSITLEIAADGPMGDVALGIGVFNSTGTRIAGLQSCDTGCERLQLSTDTKNRITCTIPQLNLMPNEYRLSLVIQDSVSRTVIDRVPDALAFDIFEEDVYGTSHIPKGPAVVFLPVEWTVESSAKSATGSMLGGG